MGGRSVWGKIICGAGGFALGGPVGALVGSVAGHLLDRARDRGLLDRLFPLAEEPRPAGFTAALVALAGKMARADGAVRREELAAFLRLFHVPPRLAPEVAELYENASRTADGFEPFAWHLAEMFADHPALLEEVLETLVVVGLADGPLKPAESSFLEAVAAIFGLPGGTIERILARHAAPEHADPFRILGVPREAGPDEIKAAYRRLIREHHPDALAGRGLPPELVAAANRRMAAINAAYESIRKSGAAI